MVKFSRVLFTAAALILTGRALLATADTSECLKCDEVAPGSPHEVRIEYRDGSTRSACGLRCAGAMLAAYRGKDVRTISVKEYGTGNPVEAKKAFWVETDGLRAAFSRRSDAESFASSRGGRVLDYRAMMTGLFSGMYEVIGKAWRTAGPVGQGEDIPAHPSCVYCGMDRNKFSHSRVLLRYTDGSEVGLCSLHCAGIDLALHPEKTPARIMVGTFDKKSLIDADGAVWVLGGAKQGVMSIRGKWAFGSMEDAETFIAGFGGSLSDLRQVMTAAFEDMWEIIR